MRSLRFLLVPVFIATSLFAQSPKLPAGEEGAQRYMPDCERMNTFVDSLLSLMTLEEKVGQLCQYSSVSFDSITGTAVNPKHLDYLRAGKVGSFLNVHGAAITRAIQKVAINESRLKIPVIFGLDVIHGFKTTFPTPLASAASWNPSLLERATRIAAIEASAAGIHWTFGPMVDIARDPRWGRIAEGAGEDPYLGSAMAAAQVRGFQGKSLRDLGSVAACAKHFVAYGAAEGGRDYNTTDMSERTLREVYLRPFEAAVRAGAMTLMSSFNDIAGVPSTANPHTLTDILRGEWKFQGFVVSDWTSVNELIAHGFAANGEEAARLGETAGTDMDMEADLYRMYLPGLVKAGKVPISVIDESVRRILRVKYALGLFIDPYRFCDPVREKSVMLTTSSLTAAREIARECIVLLKNDGSLLPFSDKMGTLAVIGPLAMDQHSSLGAWANLGEAKHVVSLMEGIKKSSHAPRNILYAKGCDIESKDVSGIPEAVETAKKADVVLLAVGESEEMSGEAYSRSNLELPGHQLELVKAIQATGKPVVLVVMSGRPLTIGWEADHVPAILETWHLGHQAGNAIADVLFGEYNPSGKLPATFPRTVGQIPFYYNHRSTGRPGDDTVHFSSKYQDLPLTPLYPFGFGLSYTKFTYSHLTNTPKAALNGTIAVSVDVTNSGMRAGEEVVQLYIRDDFGSVTRPVKELKGFKKIALAPGETKRVDFTLTPESLSFYGLDMKLGVEPGSFHVYVGTNSAEVLAGTFEITAQ